MMAKCNPYKQTCFHTWYIAAESVNDPDSNIYENNRCKTSYLLVFFCQFEIHSTRKVSSRLTLSDITREIFMQNC